VPWRGEKGGGRRKEEGGGGRGSGERVLMVLPRFSSPLPSRSETHFDYFILYTDGKDYFGRRKSGRCKDG
jgi:hypothetical protein